jgi:hypothetical protein
VSCLGEQAENVCTQLAERLGVNLTNTRLSPPKSQSDICEFHAFVVIHGQDSLRHVGELLDALSNQLG